MTKKVHVGCGDVYLKDYINCDLRGMNTYLASDRPDLVDKNGTTEDNYYGNKKDRNTESVKAGLEKKEIVVDEYASFFDLPGSSWTLDEILSRQVFEHLSIGEAHRALDECDKKLAPGGILRIDVPDHEGTLLKFKETKDEFYIRHLLGPRGNDYGYHMMSYNKDGLISLVESHGFIFEKEEENIHFYPALCLRFRKPGPRPAYDYFKDLIKIKDTWIVGEIGPGRNPHPRANVYFDISQNFLDGIRTTQKSQKEYICGDLSKKTPFADKYFDYLIVSHVIEHLKSLDEAVKEIGRIAKRGIIIAPNLFKEFMYNFEEDDHLWWFLPTENPSDPLVAINQKVKWMDKVKDIDYSSAACRLYRTGPNDLGAPQRELRKWFYNNEPNLDVVHVWEETPKCQILG